MLASFAQSTATHQVHQPVLFFITQIKFIFLSFEAFPLPFFILLHAYLMICTTQIFSDASIPRLFVDLIVVSRYPYDTCLLLTIFAFWLQSIYAFCPM